MTETMPPSWEAYRERLKQEIIPRTEGLNLARVEAYTDSLGLPAKDYLVYDESDLPKVQELSEDAVNPEWIEQNAATYIPETDFVLLRRDYERERANGPVYTEGVLIHELAHASNSHRKYRKQATAEGMEVRLPRTGFSVLNPEFERGTFFEEGFCDYIRAEYVKQYQNRLRAIQMLRLFYPRNTGKYQLDATFKAAHSEQRIPAKYFFAMPDPYTPVISSSSVAGFGVELLCKRSPELFPKLIQARSDLEALRAVPRLINDLSPGMYEELRDLEDTEESFDLGLKTIVDRLYGGKLPLAKFKEVAF